MSLEDTETCSMKMTVVMGAAAKLVMSEFSLLSGRPKTCFVKSQLEDIDGSHVSQLSYRIAFSGLVGGETSSTYKNSIADTKLSS